MYWWLRTILKLTVVLLVYNAVLIALVLPYGWIVIAALGVGIAGRKTVQYSAYGTARWASVEDLEGLVDANEGIIVGHITATQRPWAGVKALFDRRLDEYGAVTRCLAALRRKQWPRLVRLSRAIHTAVFAPTGAGKGVSIVIPHLLTCRDSMVVVDFKGELTRITAQARRDMGQRVVVLDPFGQVGGADTFNPLDFIDPDDPHAIDDCRDLAEALVVRTGEEKEPHWLDAAEIWTAAMAATVVAFAEKSDRSLQSLRLLLTNPEKMQAAIKLMCESDVWDGMLSRIGHQLTQFRDKELGSTLTSTNRFLRFLDTIAIANNTRASTFNPAALKEGKLTVFLVLPLDRIKTVGPPMLRMWVGAMLRACLRSGPGERSKVHFVCDEAYSLGKMDQLAGVLTYGRSYGVRLLLIYQDLGQLKTCWPNGADQTLQANCSTVFFGVNDPFTAEQISNRLGEYTNIVSSGGTGWSVSRQGSSQGPGSSSYSTSGSDNWQQSAGKLLRPEQVVALDPRIAITFTPGVPPLATYLTRYFERYRSARGVGPVKAVVDTACLFVLAAFFAVVLTAMAASPEPRVKGESRVQGEAGVRPADRARAPEGPGRDRPRPPVVPNHPPRGRGGAKAQGHPRGP